MNWLNPFLLRFALRLASVMVVLTPVAAIAQVTAPADTSSYDDDETAQGSSSIPTLGPKVSNPLLFGSDMVWATQHDARWAIRSGLDMSSASSRIASLLAKGNTMFVKTGDIFGKTLQAYQEVVKWVEMYHQMESMWNFVQNYQLRVNLYRFLPLMSVDAPDEMGGGQAFAVGFLPKNSTGWEARANLLNDNPWYRKGGGLRLVEVRFPHTINDITFDSSVWGTDTVDEEIAQKMLMAGMYEGVSSAAVWMTGAGIQNNLADNIAPMGPKGLARRLREIRLNRLNILQKRRDLLNQAAGGIIPLGAMSPADVLDQIASIDKEIADLTAKINGEYIDEQMADAAWMRQASFVNEILSKLEHRERRLALMKLSERYRKYEMFWADPDQMNPTPEITGNPKVDNAITVLWQALTLLSKGKIPPPTPVPGGLAAEAQAVMVKSEYRELMVDELRAVRRLLAFRYVTDKQKSGADETMQVGKYQIEDMMRQLKVHESRINTMVAGKAIRDKVIAAGGGWAFNLPGGPGGN